MVKTTTISIAPIMVKTTPFLYHPSKGICLGLSVVTVS